MEALNRNTLLTLLFGIAVGAAGMWLWPQQELAAGTANSTDKFSMVTVPVQGIADTEAVFVLDHLTGILRGGRLNSANGKFTHQFIRNIAEDFQVQSGQTNPEYCIVSGAAQFNAGGNQPALGAIYIAEKASGAVIAYGFPMPRGRGSELPLPLAQLHFFNFREGI